MFAYFNEAHPHDLLNKNLQRYEVQWGSGEGREREKVLNTKMGRGKHYEAIIRESGIRVAQERYPRRDTETLSTACQNLSVRIL